MQNELRLFQVREKKEIHYFTIKTQAKEKRNELLAKGQKDACVEKGPDHEKHFNNRTRVGWNKGKHPKKGHKGRSQQKSFWQK